MGTQFDQKKLLRFLDDLFLLTGFRANIFDPEGRDVCRQEYQSAFCESINASAEGNRRCVACDTLARRHCHDRGEIQFYRCHAGICEVILPIYSRGTLAAYVSIGQFLERADVEGQWERSRERLDWYPGDMAELEGAFRSLSRYSDREIAAYVEILEGLISSIELRGLMLEPAQTELQKLESYLNEHYMEKLSLASVAEALQIGRTKLCGLARKLSDGKTLFQLIAERRLRAAQTLLLQTDLPISAVGEAVGISDYNYFSRIFRRATGMTPSTFRKEGQAGGSGEVCAEG